jgi:sporulation protein YlmC with PRC-barrel domain
MYMAKRIRQLSIVSIQGTRAEYLGKVKDTSERLVR